MWGFGDLHDRIRDIGLKDIREIGSKIALFPLVTLMGTMAGCLKTCMALLQEGRQDNAGIPFNFQELHEFWDAGNLRGWRGNILRGSGATRRKQKRDGAPFSR